MKQQGFAATHFSGLWLLGPLHAGTIDDLAQHDLGPGGILVFVSDTMPVLHQNKRDFIEFFMGFLVMKPLGMSDTILLWPFIVDLPIKHGDFP